MGVHFEPLEPIEATVLDGIPQMPQAATPTTAKIKLLQGGQPAGGQGLGDGTDIVMPDARST